jgi:tripartite-type tricarboxylate transporter receptor subunit TctC
MLDVKRLAITAALACALAPAAMAAEFPSKPVTLVVPYQAGGSTETMARVFAGAMEKQLGQPVIVATKPGAGGAVGATFVAKAPADGYTILFAAATALTWPPLTMQVDYKPDSFRWIASITEYQQALVATPDKPYKTFKELVAHAKANPGMNFADQSALSRAYINYMAKKEGVSWTAIPTKGGGEMVPFLLGGKVDIAWSGGIHQKYGDKMQVLASFNATRLADAPDAPSLKEIYGISMPSYAVVVAPAGTPDAAADKLEAAMAAAGKDAGFNDLLTDKLKFPNAFVGSKALAPLVKEMIADLKTVVEATN